MSVLFDSFYCKIYKFSYHFFNAESIFLYGPQDILTHALTTSQKNLLSSLILVAFQKFFFACYPRYLYYHFKKYLATSKQQPKNN